MSTVFKRTITRHEYVIPKPISEEAVNEANRLADLDLEAAGLDPKEPNTAWFTDAGDSLVLYWEEKTEAQ
ncbi:hypothetical protein LG293_15955 (plasmid) [Citricoccus nitrophenolicus]